jgi:hypothetical protein
MVAADVAMMGYHQQHHFANDDMAVDPEEVYDENGHEQHEEEAEGPVTQEDAWAVIRYVIGYPDVQLLTSLGSISLEFPSFSHLPRANNAVVSRIRKYPLLQCLL